MLLFPGCLILVQHFLIICIYTLCVSDAVEHVAEAGFAKEHIHQRIIAGLIHKSDLKGHGFGLILLQRRLVSLLGQLDIRLFLGNVVFQQFNAGEDVDQFRVQILHLLFQQILLILQIGNIVIDVVNLILGIRYGLFHFLNGSSPP